MYADAVMGNAAIRRVLRTVVTAMLAIATGCAPAVAQRFEIASSDPTEVEDELVVLVHGMGRTSLSMFPMELWLERAGFRVLNFGYSSFGPSIEEIAEELDAALAAESGERVPRQIHFVGHSLGNIVVRYLLADAPGARQYGRFVMLAAPNHGAAAADRYAPLLEWLLEPLDELTTDGSTVTRLPLVPEAEHLVVAGRWDGKVALLETCMPAAVAHIVVPSGHTLILMREDVAIITEQFLRDGTVHPDAERVRCPVDDTAGESGERTRSGW